MSRERSKAKTVRKNPVSPKVRQNLPDDFLSVARRLECDEDKGRFEKALRKIAKAKPK